MDIDSLVDRLASDVKPVPRGIVGRRIALGILAGGLATILLIVMTIGINPNLADAASSYPFWVKWIYALSLGVVAVSAVCRIARPEARLPQWLWLAGLPVLVLAAIGVFEMSRVPPTHWLAMWLGESWYTCPWLVLTLAMPIFFGLLWSFRKLAPTDLRGAGAVAGLAAGAIAAMLYCLHCPEMSAIFVLTWYTLGILLAAAVGALLGPRVLRW